MQVGRPEPARGPGPDFGSDAVPAELLDRVSELTLVLHEVTVQAHELVGLLRHRPDGERLHPLVGGEVGGRFLLLLAVRSLASLREDLLEAPLRDGRGLGEVLFLVAVLQLFVVFLFVRLWLFEYLAHDFFPCAPERTWKPLYLGGV